jgi:hypothetical protein
MASHFVGFVRGQEGTQPDDYTTGTSTNASAVIEVRLDDASGMRSAEISKAMEMLRHFFSNPALFNTAGFIITP